MKKMYVMGGWVWHAKRCIIRCFLFLLDLTSLLLYILGFVFNIWSFLFYMFRFYSIFYDLYSIYPFIFIV